MKVVLKVLAVFFGLGFLGQLVAGKFFFAGLALSILCAYFGWKKSNDGEKDNTT